MGIEVKRNIGFHVLSEIMLQMIVCIRCYQIDVKARNRT